MMRSKRGSLTAPEIVALVLIGLVIIIPTTIMLTQCGAEVSGNKQILDLTYNFDYAYIQLPNGEVIEGEVESWRDYGDGDQLQVTIDGTTYLVHSSDCVLVSKGRPNEH